MNEEIHCIRLFNIYGAAGGNYAGNVYDIDGIAPALNDMEGGNRQPLVEINGKTISKALQKTYDGLRIRKLTPKECWRLMGFTDEEFSKAREVNSDTQLYKQAGNSIVVDVLEAILRNLLTSDRREGDQQLTLFEGNEGGEEWQNGKPE